MFDRPTKRAGLNSPADEEADGPSEGATPVFVGHRERLFAVVYSMLGSVADTEDVLQETWLSWDARSRRSAKPKIDNPRAYLVRTAVNHALTRKAAISRRRETYLGSWLPEPLVTSPTVGTLTGGVETGDAADHALRNESVSMALLVVLETLTPLERAVFVLNEVFGYAHTEIADILDRSPSAVRQLAHRAREHVHARRPRYRAHPRTHRQATERFVAAALGGDVTALMEILAPEVTLWTDGGGKARSALRPVHGREKVARLLAGYASRPPEDLHVRHQSVNGDASAVIFAGGAPYAVMLMDLTSEGDQVSAVYLVTNPDKLAGVTPDSHPPAEATTPTGACPPACSTPQIRRDRALRADSAHTTKPGPRPDEGQSEPGGGAHGGMTA